MNLLILFAILNVVNVVIQTVKSIATITCGKTVASVVNAVAYGLYTVVLVYTNADFPLWEKILVVALTNLIGVYVVKLIEEKMRKDKMWLVEATVKEANLTAVCAPLAVNHIPYSKIAIEGTDRHLVKIYCATKKESAEVKKVLNLCNAKYFVSESKAL